MVMPDQIRFVDLKYKCAVPVPYCGRAEEPYHQNTSVYKIHNQAVRVYHANSTVPYTVTIQCNSSRVISSTRY